MTLYLKYRPQIVEELDETAVREAMKNILVGKNLPHAWLFSGPRGTGKTSSARILAKAINCLQKKDFEPCNQCGMCEAIMAGNAPDVIEIDAASNRGIEEIRELREKVRLAPMQAKYKVYIIDEVHMLTTEAANALLKTLEEPPASTIFVLCTTDPEKLPETVISRCTRIQFKKPTAEEAARSLKRVIKGEGKKAEDQALAMIAREARGSFRDGTKILEQVLLGHKEITEEAVREVTGQLVSADPEVFIQLWYEKKQQECLAYIEKMVNNGVNLRSWVERVVEALRQQLLFSITNNQASRDKQYIISQIQKLDKVYEQMKTAAVIQLPLEIMVLEEIAEPPAAKEGERKVDKEKVISKSDVKTPQSDVSRTAHPSTGSGLRLESGSRNKDFNYSLIDITNKWQEILKAVKPKNHSIEGLLRSTRAIEFDGEKLTLEVFYKFHKDKLETEKCRMIVEESVGEVFGTGPVKLFLKLGQKETKKEDNNISGQVGEDIIAAAAEIFKAEVV